MKKTLAFVYSLTVATTLAVAGAETDRSVLDNAVSTAKIHSFTEILRNSGIPIEQLRKEEITLLIPVDVSFYDLTPEQYQRLLSPNDRALAVKYIESHMIKGRFSLRELEASKHWTVSGAEVTAATTSGAGETAINGHAIVDDKIVGRNGHAYLIHGFLMSP